MFYYFLITLLYQSLLMKSRNCFASGFFFLFQTAFHLVSIWILFCSLFMLDRFFFYFLSLIHTLHTNEDDLSRYSSFLLLWILFYKEFIYIWFAPNLSSTFERCIYISKSNFSISANKQTVAKTQLYFQPLYCDPNSFISMLTELPATLSIWYE